MARSESALEARLFEMHSTFFKSITISYIRVQTLGQSNKRGTLPLVNCKELLSTRRSR
jgi:hypothetical protein